MLKTRATKRPALIVLAMGLVMDFGVQAQAQGINRTMLQTSVYPGTQYVTALYMLEIEPGTTIPPHTHPGLATTYVLEGELEVAIDGQGVKHYKAGDSFQVPAGVVHSSPPAAKTIKLLVNYVAEKDKPLMAIVEPK